MAKSTLTVRIHIDGIFETLRALSKLPKDVQNEIRDTSLQLSKSLATKVAQAGVREGSQAALVSATVKARRDRVPVIVAGGMKKLGRNRKPAFKLLFGSEFGSNRYSQFHKPHIGKGSYWFFKEVDENKEEIFKAWNEAADRVVNEFGRGG